MRWSGVVLGVTLLVCLWAAWELLRDRGSGSDVPERLEPAPEPVKAAPAADAASAGDRFAPEAAPRARSPRPRPRAPAAAPSEIVTAETPRRPDADSFMDVLSPAVRQLVEQAEEEERVRRFIELLDYMPEREALDRIAVVLIESRQRHVARMEAFARESWKRDDEAARQERGARRRKLDEECRSEQREALRPFIRPDVFEEVMQQWSEASLEDDGG
ncbi:MAG: hypothetical protein HY812_13115 [Planctomycetes bacterium]|nr:hypothetical protein [Planctomycetota bacterium]